MNQKLERIDCPCGGHYTKYFRRRHEETSSIHLKYIGVEIPDELKATRRASYLRFREQHQDDWNTQTICPCGGSYVYRDKYRHFQTFLHRNYLGLEDTPEVKTKRQELYKRRNEPRKIKAQLKKEEKAKAKLEKKKTPYEEEQSRLWQKVNAIIQTQKSTVT